MVFLMSLFQIGFNRLLAVAALSIASYSAHSEVLFQDGFESAAFATKTISTVTGAVASWIDRDDVSVVSGHAKSGVYAAKLHFTGNLDPSVDAWSELRFDLGKLTPEVWIKYDLYIPANYIHRGTGTNNKFFRLWGATYGEHEQVGASMWPNHNGDGFSRIVADWYCGSQGMTSCGQFNEPHIVASDRGTWVTFKIYVKAATAQNFGTMKIWKNNTLIVDDTNLVDNYFVSGTHAYRYGYILGWANSGFAQDTDFYLDNVIMGTAQADIDQTAPAVASPPSSPLLQVK